MMETPTNVDNYLIINFGDGNKAIEETIQSKYSWIMTFFMDLWTTDENCWLTT